MLYMDDYKSPFEVFINENTGQIIVGETNDKVDKLNNHKTSVTTSIWTYSEPL
jgi:hypothetical protein